MTTDPLGVISDVNQQMEALTGYTREQLIGTPFKQFFTNPQRAEEGIKLVLGEGTVTNYELTARSLNGTETVVSYNGVTFYDRDGKLQGVFAAARDITERKEFEQTLQEKNVELERANLAKDRFLASISHELRTPLNAIIGFTGTLLMQLPGPLTEDQAKQLTTIQTSAKHLLSLINDLLDLARIDSGKVEIAFESVLGQDVLEDIANTLRPAAEAKGLKFEICLPSKPLHLQTDPRSLSQILINLTNNAIKFTQQGSVQLELKRRKEKGQQFVEFSVADTGIGIPAEEQVKLFDAFTRLNNPALQYQEGTGLGLYLSQKLADLLGGKIKLQSKPEQGSIFTLILEEK
jgi:PAS domain S-box-containing protein